MTEYTCANCKGLFLRASTDAEADAESFALFGIQNASKKIGPDDEMAIVCDDCFRAMKKHFGWPDV